MYLSFKTHYLPIHFRIIEIDFNASEYKRDNFKLMWD